MAEMVKNRHLLTEKRAKINTDREIVRWIMTKEQDHDHRGVL
jgi:hypothetical protein